MVDAPKTVSRLNSMICYRLHQTEVHWFTLYLHLPPAKFIYDGQPSLWRFVCIENRSNWKQKHFPYFQFVQFVYSKINGQLVINWRSPPLLFNLYNLFMFLSQRYLQIRLDLLLIRYSSILIDFVFIFHKYRNDVMCIVNTRKWYDRKKNERKISFLIQQLFESSIWLQYCFKIWITHIYIYVSISDTLWK